MSWNYGDILDAMGEVVPADNACLIHGDRLVTWGDFTRRSNNLARALRERGVDTGDKVAFYMRNHPAYCEALGACFKGRLVHVNVNYRYVDEELHYIFDNSDAKAVVFSSEFADHVRNLRARLPKVALWIEVAEGGVPSVEFACDFDTLAERGAGTPLALERSGEDLLFLYTGGTTGMPKGVMWDHESLWFAGAAGATPENGMVPPPDLAAHAENVRAMGGGRRLLPCCPLMHGTGLFTSIATLAAGGSVVTLTHPSFDAAECLAAVERHRVNGLAIVGDAFAAPLLRELEANPGRYDIDSLTSIISSGVMWSQEVKEGLLRHHPGLVLTDSFGASEAVGFASSQTTAEGTVQTARFAVGEYTKVFTPDYREVQPGSDEVGFVARRGAIPRGYYKDDEKTAKTFPVIGGVRYSIPGDWCRVEADGSLTLLGRGSVCINTAGEKVYPEEVEEVLKQHPAVDDALVVGVPDPQWGEMVTAVVAFAPGAEPEEVDEESMRRYVRGRLAGYKTPKRVVAIDTIGRADNGKADYQRVTEYAKRRLGVAAGS